MTTSAESSRSHLTEDATSVSDALVARPTLDLATLQPLDQNPAAVYLARLGSEKSRASQRSHLRRIVRLLGGEDLFSFPWARLRYQHVTALRTKIAEGSAPATANAALCALRGVLREAWKLGQMSSEDCFRACGVDGVRGSREPAGRALSQDELAALFRVCDLGTWAGARDAALLALLYGAGLRRSEAVGLDLEHVDPVSGQLRVIGKGNKERITFVPPGALRALRVWLEKRGAAPGPLFWRVRKGDQPVPARLSDRAVADILAEMGERAGVGGFTTHDCRRTWISDALDLGADLATVQKMAGHSDPTTTSKYDRRGERAKVRVAESIRVPFEGWG
jgi:integrase